QIGLGSSANAQDLWKVNYDYGNADNNGNVKSQQITVPSQFTAVQNYTYDSLNRLKDAKEVIETTETWKQAFTFDRYGNRKFDPTQTTTLGNCPQNVCNPDINSANNRVVGHSFYNSGNTTVDAEGRQFFYDAENKQKEVRDASNNIIGQYLYDGDGKRIKKIAPNVESTIFVYDAGGKLASEYTVSASQQQAPQTSYLTNDTLGSLRVTTDQAGAVVSRRDFRPYGEEISRPNQGTDKVRQKFTAYERDNETELDFAQARFYNSKLGRFSSPDPLLASGKAPNPQTWNRYNYVGNNPINITDPFGLDWYYNKEENRYLWSADGKTFKDGTEVGSGWKSVVGNTGEGGSFSYQSDNGNWVALDPYSNNFQANIASKEDATKLVSRLYDLTPDIREFAAGYNKNYDRNINIVTAMAAASGIVIAAPYVATAVATTAVTPAIVTPLPQLLKGLGGGKAVGNFLGWGQGTTILKSATDFTKKQLIEKGLTKEVLTNIYTGLMEQAQLTVKTQGQLNQAGVARANQVKQILETHFK
ncbi:MAG: RHS repeat-associated core domain-containing protein, partial [Acidobacteriota bacterium]